MGDLNSEVPLYSVHTNHVTILYSGTSLLTSPTGLDKSDHNGEVNLLQGVICTVEYNFGLIQGSGRGLVIRVLDAGL